MAKKTPAIQLTEKEKHRIIRTILYFVYRKMLNSGKTKKTVYCRVALGKNEYTNTLKKMLVLKKLNTQKIIQNYSTKVITEDDYPEPSPEDYECDLIPLDDIKTEMVYATFSTDFKTLYKYLDVQRKTKKPTYANIDRALFISKDSSGQFFSPSKPIKFENTDTIYYKIFDALYENPDLDGFCSYEKINKFLEEFGEKTITDKRKMIERISNGLKNLWRYSNLPDNKRAPDGKLLIKTNRGRGLTFYNPPI